MEDGRRGFLKIAGLTVLGLAGGRSFQLVGGSADAAEAEAAAAGGGTRWAMVVDPRKCLDHADCTACTVACHTAHNVPSFDDPRHEVKWIWKESFHQAFEDQELDYVDEQLTESRIPITCNHCDNPPCVRVCPTQATWKRDDGVVMMDWHRCVGCRYCVAACPYGSRSFNWTDPRPYIAEITPDFPTRTRGVVEKCTFCEERLEKGGRPACVEACEERALVFGNLNDPESEVRQLLRTRFAVRRKPVLGTQPKIYYLV